MIKAWWQNLPENINPNLIEIGSFKIGWYWLMYVVAFLVVYLLLNYRYQKDLDLKQFKYIKQNLDKNKLLDLLTYLFIGLIIGARFGYLLIYDLSEFLSNSLIAINPFVLEKGRLVYQGIYGMSYHGGLIGVIVAYAIYIYKFKLRFWKVIDFIIPCIPLGYFFGRIGNFLNGELYGRVTELSIGMYFPRAYIIDNGSLLRHPSQLYEAFFEGIVIFAILWFLRNRIKKPAVLSAIYLILYGSFRFLIEFLREPDLHIGFVVSSYTMGQILSLLMILSGLILIAYSKKKRLIKNKNLNFIKRAFF
jgi:phosphatidylglycerol:prolipoprotein diacylglycerol transferase